jgi:hypothetical protein
MVDRTRYSLPDDSGTPLVSLHTEVAKLKTIDFSR